MEQHAWQIQLPDPRAVRHDQVHQAARPRAKVCLQAAVVDLLKRRIHLHFYLLHGAATLQ
eukprot:scaffold1541_cov418-Prasinococcus_capsulatus_cf.AAC.11